MHMHAMSSARTFASGFQRQTADFGRSVIQMSLTNARGDDGVKLARDSSSFRDLSTDRIQDFLGKGRLADSPRQRDGTNHGGEARQGLPAPSLG